MLCVKAKVATLYGFHMNIVIQILPAEEDCTQLE